MKKLFFALLIACSFLTITAAANDVKVSGKVITAFKTSFQNASNVKWSVVKDLYLANFEMENEQYSAYFDNDGEMVVLARFITESQLPRGLKENLKSHTGDNSLLYLFELSDDEGVFYYATMQNGNKKTMLRSAGKKWAPYTKVKI